MKYILSLIIFSVIFFSCGERSSEADYIPIAVDSVSFDMRQFEAMKIEAESSTYYVSPSGSDANDGSESKPFQTLTKVWSKIGPGDLVYLRGGTYTFNSTQYLNNKSGTALNLIKIWAYPGEKPVLSRGSGFNQTHSNELISFSGNYFHFKDIEIANFSQRKGEHAYPAFRANPASNCTWENVNYHHNAAAFSLKGNSSNNTFLNCDFSHNQDPYSSSPYDGADGLDMHDLTGTNNTIRGCRAFWNADDGFDFWDNNGYVLIENSWSFFNGYIPGTFNTAGNGSGIKLGSTSNQASKLLRTVKNNLVYKNRSYGIVENAAICKSDILNNTVSNSGEIGLWFGSWGTNVATFRGNISYKAPQPTRFSQYENHSGNSWNLSYTMKDTDFQSWTESQLTAPRKPDGQLPATNFAIPVATSPIAAIGYRPAASGPVEPPVDPPVDTTYTIIKTWIYNTNGTKTVTMGEKPNAKRRLVYSQELTIKKDSSVVAFKAVRYK